MSKTIHMKQGHGKVLAKNSTYPYFSVNCPCQQPILTGKWFADYIEYNLDTDVYMNASYWPYQHVNGPGDSSWDIARQILQTIEIAAMSSVNAYWTPSAVINPQYNFYDCSIPWGIQGGKDTTIYRTGMLTQTESSFILPIKLLKENKWWTYTNNKTIVSGNSASGIYDCYNLSTAMTELRLRKNQSSGFISSLILNNCDNTFKVQDFITGSTIFQYSIQVNDTDTEIPTLSTTYPDGTVINYSPVNDKVEAATLYYLSRIYRGDQEGYLFTPVSPDEYETGLGPQIVDRWILAGADNVPTTGKAYYFEQYNWGENFQSLVKKDNKYYRYDFYDQKTIVEVPSSSVQSANLIWDEWSASINKVTTGLIVQGTQIYDTPLLSTSDGLMLQESNGEYYPINQFSEQYMGEYWSNYQYTVGQNTYYTTKIYDHTGQYFIIQPYEEEIIGDINYNWEYYVCFPTDYNAVTSSCTMDVYKFGYYYDNDISDYVYCSGFTAASTTILTARVQNYQDYQHGYMEDPQPQCNWDTTISAFCYEQGGGIHNHPDYLNYYFDLITGYNQWTQEPIYNRYYVYKGPAWAVLYQANSHLYFGNYIVTGNSYDTVQCWTVDDIWSGGEPEDLVPISAGWYCAYNGSNSRKFLRTVSGQNYWQVVSGTPDPNNPNQYIDAYIPLTGGSLFNPQKTVAADDPDRPPYWYFSDGDLGTGARIREQNYYTSFLSGRYIARPEDSEGNYKSIGIIVPLYYDTEFGSLINYFHDEAIDGILANDQVTVIDTMWPRAVEMIKDHAYNSTEGFACPFVKYIEKHDKYYSDQDNPTVSNFLSNNYLNDTTSAYYFLYNDHYPREFMCDYGGDKANDDGTSYNYDLGYQKFTKMTAEEIADPFNYSRGFIDHDLSAVLPFMDGLYCQILTGFWIRKKSDDNKSICGIRKNGQFTQLLSFDTFYHFGYDLNSVNSLDSILGDDTSICYQRNGNSYVARQVKDYWADMKNTFTTVGNMNTSKFRSFCYIRVLSGHFSVPVQP